jgi:general secretion pathway protein A
MEQPAFNNSPDPSFLYLTPLLKTAIHKLKYVVERRQGATAILGDLGLGKSSLMRLLLREYVTRDGYRVAYLPTPSFKSDYGFLKAICRELHLPPRRSLVDQQSELEAFVLKEFVAGRNVVLLVDEGQRLDTHMLEVLRVLTNFETDDAKCLQIVVAGQLELQEKLNEKRNRALKSRIFAPTILSPLSLEEAFGMVAFRCELAGIPNPFPAATIEAIYERAGGVPREIVFICNMAYEFMCVSGQSEVPPEFVAGAAKEARLP